MSNAEVIVLVIAVIVVVNLMTYVRKHSDKALYTTQRKRRLFSSVRARFSADGVLSDQVMLRCLSDRKGGEIFEDYRSMSLEERRIEFCSLCLGAVYGYGTVEVAVLSRESASAYRALIGSLPGSLRHFYETDKSLYDVRLSRAITASLKSTGEGVGNYRLRQEELCTWTEIHLPEHNEKRFLSIAELTRAFRAGELMLRFKRPLTLGTTNSVSGVEERQEEHS